MPEIVVRGISINFPYDVYDIQKDYMEKVLECLQTGSNGILESPTGTGKTLSLLCSSLAWLCVQRASSQMNTQRIQEVNESNFFSNLKNKLDGAAGQLSSDDKGNHFYCPPKIIYASRTHSQLNQVMLELKKTAYSHVKVGILGSRDQLCIHPQVSNENNISAKVNMCKILVASRSCHFYNNVETKTKDPVFREQRLVDIEDLIKKGRKTNCCPYFASRELQYDCDILFAPYNYLLDPKTRKSHNIRLLNDVIILDEGHNVEKVCEESSSSHLSSTTLALCINEITTVMKLIHSEAQKQANDAVESNVPKDFTADDLCLLKTMFMVIEKAVDDIKLTGNDSKKSAVFPGSYIFSILEKASITFSKLPTLLDILNKVSQFLLGLNERKGTAVFKFTEFIEVVFHSLGKNHSTQSTDIFYKLYVENEVIKQNKTTSLWDTPNSEAMSKNGKILHFWCFSPSFGMRSLLDQDVRCVILSSGTLAPLSATISEIGIPFNVQLCNPHIIKPNQICAVVVENGPANNELRCVYQNRSNKAYLTDLGQSCLNLYRIIPGGALVVFPSYPFLSTCIDHWKSIGLWDKMTACKAIFVEPQSRDALKSIMDEYYKLIDEKSGASLFAVCRGKVSEGMDFADSKARAVIIIGLPLPPFNDPRVCLKREYLDSAFKNSTSSLNGGDWYKLEAMRAVNQAVGRVIRHKDDHGAIIFCDTRYAYQCNTKSLSLWLQSHVVTHKSFGLVVRQVSSFFRTWKDTSTSSTRGNESNQEQLGFSQSPVSVRKIQPAQKLATTSSSESVAHISRMYSQPPAVVSLHPVGSLAQISCAYKSPRETLDGKNTMIDETMPKKNILECLYHDSNQGKMTTYSKPVEFQHAPTTSSNWPVLNNGSQASKKRKLTIVPLQFNTSPDKDSQFDPVKYSLKIQNSLNADDMKRFKTALAKYTTKNDYKSFIKELSELLLPDKSLRPLYKDLPYFLKTEEHKKEFWKTYTQAMKHGKLELN